MFFYMAFTVVIVYGIYRWSKSSKARIEKQWEGTKNDLMALTKKDLDTFAYKWYNLKLDARTKKADMVETIWKTMIESQNKQ